MLHYAQQLKYIDVNIQQIMYTTNSLFYLSFPECSMPELIQYLHATEASFSALAFTCGPFY